MKNVLIYNFFVVFVWGVGSTIGLLTRPAEWFETLIKPSFNPPNWVFAPVWTLLYILIAIAGARTWLKARNSCAMRFWYAQLFFNFLWSPVFFGAQKIGLAFILTLFLLASIAAFISSTHKDDKVAALMFVPYMAWVAFAAILNLSIWILN